MPKKVSKSSFVVLLSVACKGSLCFWAEYFLPNIYSFLSKRKNNIWTLETVLFPLSHSFSPSVQCCTLCFIDIKINTHTHTINSLFLLLTLLYFSWEWLNHSAPWPSCKKAAYLPKGSLTHWYHQSSEYQALLFLNMNYTLI